MISDWSATCFGCDMLPLAEAQISGVTCTYPEVSRIVEPKHNFSSYKLIELPQVQIWLIRLSINILHITPGLSENCHKQYIFVCRPNNFNCMYMPHCLYLSISGHWGCFHILALVSNASVNLKAHICIKNAHFNIFGYILWSGHAESYGSSTFNFLRSLHNCWMILHLYQQSVNFNFATFLSACVFCYFCL